MHTVHDHFIVQMSACGTSCVSDQTDKRTALDGIAAFHIDFGHMRITGDNAVAMVDFDTQSVSTVTLCNFLVPVNGEIL